MQGPRIDSITAHIVETKMGFAYSFGTLESTRSVIWEISGGGSTGFGESLWSSDLRSGSVCGGAVHELVSKLTERLSSARVMAAEERRHIEHLVRPLLGEDILRLEALLPPLADLDGRMRRCREGLSIAMYDLAGQVYSMPVHALLGGKRRDRVPGMPVIHVAPPEIMARRATIWTAAGYGYLKVKLRGELDEDVAALKAIREAVGERIVIQVDANRGYQEISQAVQAILVLQRFGVDLFEDMLDAPLEQIAELRHRTQAPIMVDNQASWLGIFDVCRLQAADVINHHPNNQGGLFVALQINAVAASAGIPTAVGSSGIFGIQDAAFQSLAAVIGLTRPCEDIGLRPYCNGPLRGEYAFEHEPELIKNPYPIVDGVIHIPDAPGLGIEIDREKLEASTIARWTWD